MGFQGGSVGKNPPANAGDAQTQVPSLGREDPLEKAMATHPNILAWRIPWTEEPGWLQSTGMQRVRRKWHECTHSSIKWQHKDNKGQKWLSINHLWHSEICFVWYSVPGFKAITKTRFSTTITSAITTILTQRKTLCPVSWVVTVRFCFLC